jgi:hypothetical protein
VIVEQCVLRVFFVPLDANAPKFFGFSEFLAGLALMVLAWTIGDARYRFRIRSAPIPLQGLTFAVVAAVGTLALLTDLWRAQGWLVPQGNLLTPASWQALLASLFFLMFLTWTWIAFIRPPTFGKRNTKRYAQALYFSILKGSQTELAVVADELKFSAKELVRYATNRDKPRYLEGKGGGKEISDAEAYANDILLLIADKRFCRVIVESSPVTALAIFHEMGEAKKYGIQIETFAKNIVNEALANKNSFLYHEADGYESGLIGYLKPLSQAMFANYMMVETVGTMLDPDFSSRSKWDADQWEAYCRIVLITFRDYVERGEGGRSNALFRALGCVKYASSDLYKLNGVASSAWDDDPLARLRVTVDFIKKAVEILEKKGVPSKLQLRIRSQDRLSSKSFYDHIAGLIFEVIFAASAVTSPRDQCWWIQHNSVWGELFGFDQLGGKAGAVVKFKVRRLLYNEVARMKSFPNFKGARILGLCLNVMGLELGKDDYVKDSGALHRVILGFTKKSYAWLYCHNPRVAEACLVDDMTYDAENHRLVRTYPADGLRREPSYIYLYVDPPATGSSNAPAETANSEGIDG